MKTLKKSQIIFLVLFVSLLSSLNHAEELTIKIDKIFEQFNSEQTPGVTVAVIQDQDILFKKAYGMASLELNVPNTTQTVFRIGSVSKQFTAACIALLALEDRIDLNDPVTRYLTELPESVYGSVSVKHMIHHSSGIRDSEALYPYMGIEYARWYTHDMLLHMLARQNALSFSPGEMLEYSNSAYTLLALIVEKVTGKPFQEFIKERIFDPLGMSHTLIQTSPGTLIPQRAAGYDRDSQGYINWMTNNQLIGHDALYSSVEDMSKWAMASFNGKLDSRLIEIMTTPGTFNDGSLNNYGYGIVVNHFKGLKTWEHGGWYVGYTAYLITFPEYKFSVVCLGNNVQGSRQQECLAIAELFLADQIQDSLKKLRASAKKVNEKLLERLPGRYIGEAYAGIFPLEIKDGLPRPQGVQWSFEPSPFHKNEFIHFDDRLTLRVKAGDEGNDIVLDYLIPMGRKDRFKKMKEANYEPDGPSPILGEYWSEEIQAAATITQTEGKLRLKISLTEGELTQIAPDFYRARREKLNFYRDEQGIIKGFKLSAYGFQGVIFEKR